MIQVTEDVIRERAEQGYQFADPLVRFGVGLSEDVKMLLAKDRDQR